MRFSPIEKRGGKRSKSGSANNPGAEALFKSSLGFTNEKLVTTEQAVATTVQHTTPCSDCPFRRDALKGWLGGSSVSEFLAMAHSDMRYPCHSTRGRWSKRPQCAGLAIYRANNAKIPRDSEVLRLEKDHEAVFASPVEFRQHHEGKA